MVLKLKTWPISLHFISLEELDYFIYAFPSSISVMLYKMHNIHYKIGDRKE